MMDRGVSDVDLASLYAYELGIEDGKRRARTFTSEDVDKAINAWFDSAPRGLNLEQRMRAAFRAVGMTEK